jgi:broad specificity phosphatase PhoE
MALMSVLLVRHAQPGIAGGGLGGRSPLSEKGRSDARELGRTLAGLSAPALVWSSPEPRAYETAALAFPSAVPVARDELSEIEKPWYQSAEGHADAFARYLRGEDLDGWETRDEVLGRITRLRSDLQPTERHVLVTHGMLLAVWLDDEGLLVDPLSFWLDLRLPDAWEFDADGKVLSRVASQRRLGRPGEGSSNPLATGE